MAEARVEEDEGVEVRVVRGEGLRGVQRVEVLDVGGNFHLAAETVFDDGAPGVGRGAGWEGEFGVPIRHAFRPDED